MIPEETAALDPPREGVRGARDTGIGGLLIFIAIGLFLSLIQNSTYFLASMSPVVRGDVWETLTNPASTAYHPNWKLVLVYEFAASLLFLLLNLVALVLFFQKKRSFPKFIVAAIPAIFILALVGHYLSGSIPAVAESAMYAAQGRTLIFRFVALHIWIPYFLMSKRVERTFVR
ncbi:MAG TPA: DUF2569 domain-containing protein [Pyrinomonadaceae bacterium]|jgi:hypothetical protein